jgi:hypothetical protein
VHLYLNFYGGQTARTIDEKLKTFQAYIKEGVGTTGDNGLTL